MLDELFTFPIVLVDGDTEHKKYEDSHRMGISKQEEIDPDLIFGEAEYPYYTFMGIEDRWLPTNESVQKAMDGKFEACVVRFANVGQLLVPWSKTKFKRDIKAFGENYEKTRPPSKDEQEVRILTLSPENYKTIMDEKNKNNE